MENYIIFHLSFAIGFKKEPLPALTMRNEKWKMRYGKYFSNPFTTRAVLYQLRSKSFDRPTAVVFKTIAQPIM